DREKLLRSCHGFVEIALEAQSRDQEVHVMPMVAVAVKLVRRQVSTLVHCCVGKRLLRFIPLACLRINVTGHVQRMRNVGHQLRVSLAARPCVLREARSLPSMNNKMMYARMLGRGDQQLSQ